jgi:hypothetical protein
MKYLKLFENFKKEEKFSISFDNKFYRDVINALKEFNIKFEEKDSLYHQMKNQTELIACVDSELDLIRIIPSWVRHLHIYRQK